MPRHISQREAHRMRKRLAVLESRARPSSITPSPRWEICSVTLSSAQYREVQMGERFGLGLRWERYSDSFKLFSYREVSA